MRRLILIGVLILCGFNAWAEDEVTLKTGVVFRGEVVKDDGSEVVVELADGKATIVLRWEEIASILIEEPELFAQATAFYEKRSYEKALGLYREIARQYFRYNWGKKAQFRVGELNFKLKRWSDALTAYREFLELHPQTDLTHRAQLGRARVLYQQEQYEKAIKAYRALLEEGDLKRLLSAQALYGLGNCYFKLGEFESALISHLKVVVLFYDFEDWVKKSTFLSGRCYEKLGDFRRARTTYREVIERFAESRYAKMAEERLREIKKLKEVKKGGSG